jgi:hypothetical protein
LYDGEVECAISPVWVTFFAASKCCNAPSLNPGVAMKKIVLTFGLIAGAIMSVMMLVNTLFIDQIGFDKGVIIGYTTMVLAFLMVFFRIAIM